MLRRIGSGTRQHIQHASPVFHACTSAQLRLQSQCRNHVLHCTNLQCVTAAPSNTSLRTFLTKIFSSSSTSSRTPAQRASIGETSSLDIITEALDLLQVTSSSNFRAQVEKLGEDDPLQHLADAETAISLARHAAIQGKEQYMRQILVISHQLGVRITASEYETIVKPLVRGRNWGLVNDIVSLSKTHLGHRTLNLLNWQLRASVELHHFDSLPGALQVYEEEDVEPSRDTFHILVRGYIQNRDLPSARTALRLMAAAGFPVDASTHLVIISAYHAIGSNDSVEQRALATLGELDHGSHTAVLNSILQLRSESGDVAGVTRILNQMDGVQTSVSPSASDEDHPQCIKPTSAPDLRTFTLLIDFFTRRNDIPGALKVLLRIRDAGFVPNARIAAVLVRAYIKQDSVDQAVAIIAEMCPTVDRSLLEKLGWNGTLAGIGLAEVTPKVSVFNAALPGILNRKGIGGLHALIRIMRSIGVEPNGHTVSVLVKFLSNLNMHPRRLINVVRALLSASGLKPTLVAVNAILRSVVRFDHRLTNPLPGWKRQAALLRRPSKAAPRTKSIPPPILVDTCGVLSLGRGHQFRDAMRPFFQFLASHRIQPDSVTFALRLKHEAVVRKDVQAARAIMSDMVARGLPVRATHVSALMDGYARIGDLTSARRAMNHANELDVKPTVGMYTILVSAYARSGKPREAEKVMKEMLAAGVKPDVAFVNAMAGAYFATKEYGRARWVIKELWAHLEPPPPNMDVTGSLLARVSSLRRLRREHYGKADSVWEDRASWNAQSIVDAWKGEDFRRPVQKRLRCHGSLQNYSKGDTG